MENQTATILYFFIREIDKLTTEITAFPNEESLWEVRGSLLNATGNLALHVAGNLQHFIGAMLGNSGYVRNRDHEFAARNVPRAEILLKLTEARNIVEKTLGNMDDARLDQPYPSEFKGETQSNLYALLHLYGHLNYHLGQVNYLRRVL